MYKLNIAFALMPCTSNCGSSRRLAIPAISIFLLKALLATIFCALMFSPVVVFAIDNGESVIMTVPSEPMVPPEIPVFDEMDSDGNKVDDQLDAHLNYVRSALASRIDSITRAAYRRNWLI